MIFRNKKEKVAIIGCGEDESIDINTHDFETWTVNNCFRNKTKKNYTSF
jgi:hypothetical protein